MTAEDKEKLIAWSTPGHQPCQASQQVLPRGVQAVHWDIGGIIRQKAHVLVREATSGLKEAIPDEGVGETNDSTKRPMSLA